MGCDGGTIPRRDELVRTKQKPEQDIVELKLTQNAGYSRRDADKGDEYVDLRASKFICPVVGLEMNGKYRQVFCYLRKCGCVLSERALKEVKSEVCHKCAKPFEDDDIVILNGSDDDLAVLSARMELRRAKAKSEKKSKKRAADTAEDGVKKVKFENGVGSKKSTAVNGGASTSGAPKNSEVGTATKMLLPEKARQCYSIAKDPNTSEAFKELFTSHPKAINQPKPHWITHNPLFY
ncbi:hypothetical protein HPB48_005255 [Haemaphysalis longicornis]|uniref:Replication termination factor 2 n=1 Tax=Haemaphysalis longicornis TaxID=44386 RepID=A0A9J6FPM3_HAELO|nr:hypothetical protein HPB48_005255 [Haemaphysalis longicornis]